MRRATLTLLFLALITLQTAAAQDALGEYSKAMAAYNAYDYQAACHKMTNFYAASDSFHNIPSEVLEAVKVSGRSVADLNQDALLAENAHEPAKACAAHYRTAIRQAANQDTLPMEKSLRLARIQYQKMLDELEPAAHNSAPEAEIESAPADNSLAAIVAASKKANSGEEGCASEDALHRDAELVAPCIHHLLTLARKQKVAGQLTMAKLNYQRAIEVNSYLGTRQDPTVKPEAVRAIREIERAQRTQRQ